MCGTYYCTFQLERFFWLWRFEVWFKSICSYAAPKWKPIVCYSIRGSLFCQMRARYPLSLFIFQSFFPEERGWGEKKNRTRLLSIGGIFARRNKNAQNGTLKTAFLKKGRSPFQFRYFAENIYYYIRYIFIYNSKPNNLKMNCGSFFVSVHGRTF